MIVKLVWWVHIQVTLVSIATVLQQHPFLLFYELVEGNPWFTYTVEPLNNGHAWKSLCREIVLFQRLFWTECILLTCPYWEVYIILKCPLSEFSLYYREAPITSIVRSQQETSWYIMAKLCCKWLSLEHSFSPFNYYIIIRWLKNTWIWHVLKPQRLATCFHSKTERIRTHTPYDSWVLHDYSDRALENTIRRRKVFERMRFRCFSFLEISV